MAKIPNPYSFSSGPSDGEWLTKARFIKLSKHPKQKIQELISNGEIPLLIDDLGVKRLWSTDAHNCFVAHLKGEPPPPLEKDPTAHIHSFFSREE